MLFMVSSVYAGNCAHCLIGVHNIRNVKNVFFKDKWCFVGVMVIKLLSVIKLGKYIIDMLCVKHNSSWAGLSV